MIPKKEILGVGIHTLHMDEAVLAAADFLLKSGRCHVIATANPEMIMMAQDDPTLATALREADLVVPDGVGAVWALNRQYGLAQTRVTGFDLTQNILALSAEKGYRVFFFGSAPGVAMTAKENAEAKYPGLTVCGVRDGFFTEAEEDDIVRTINEAKADFVLVALGVPKQENWIMRHKDKLASSLIIGVGGTLDVMAGVVPRAPKWMQEAKLEWLFRLLRQPKRFLRMLALPRFVLAVLCAKKR